MEGQLICSQCGSENEVKGGFSFGFDGDGFGYRQYACGECGVLRSRGEDMSLGESDAPSQKRPPRCPKCRKTTTPWLVPEQAREEHDDLFGMGGISHEWCGGPCPRCGAPYEPDDFQTTCLWD